MTQINLTDQDIQQIKFLSKQGNGRWDLICNLFRINKEELMQILQT